VRFGGESILAEPAHRIARRGIALVPEGRQVFANLSVHEHLSAFTRRDGQGATPWHAQRVFALFPRLAERRDHWAQQLSGGEQQMLAIGRALVTNPRLLILDEATEGLAPLVREEIWRALALLRTAGQAILVIEKFLQRLITLAEATSSSRRAVAWVAVPPPWRRSGPVAPLPGRGSVTRSGRRQKTSEPLVERLVVWRVELQRSCRCSCKSAAARRSFAKRGSIDISS
jgi:hypothetical protein